MSKQLKAAAAGSPAMCLPEPVIEALQELGEAHGDGKPKPEPKPNPKPKPNPWRRQAQVA